MKIKGVLKFKIIIKWISQLYPIHLNTYVMGFLYIFIFFSAGIDLGRQKLTSTDVRFCRLKSVPALNRLSESNSGTFVMYEESWNNTTE